MSRQVSGAPACAGLCAQDRGRSPGRRHTSKTRVGAPAAATLLPQSLCPQAATCTRTTPRPAMPSHNWRQGECRPGSCRLPEPGGYWNRPSAAKGKTGQSPRSKLRAPYTMRTIRAQQHITGAHPGLSSLEALRPSTPHAPCGSTPKARSLASSLEARSCASFARWRSWSARWRSWSARSAPVGITIPEASHHRSHVVGQPS